MVPPGLFLLKSVMISGLLTTWYLVGLRNRRLHQYNRFFLLSALFASIAFPLLHLHLFSIPGQVAGRFVPVVAFTRSTVSPGDSLQIAQPPHLSLNWMAIAGVATAAISLLLLLVLLLRMVKVWMICRRYPVIRIEGINVVLTDLPKTPFTFLRNLFWNQSIPLDSEEGQLIFRHEITHIEQGHTYDNLFCQALTCIFWFNPFYWIIQKELQIVHEFIADENAVTDRDTSQFAMMLLRSCSNGIYLAPEHHFFSSTVKRRLLMLQNSGTPSYALLRRFAAVPLVAGALLMFSFTVRNIDTATADISNLANSNKTISVEMKESDKAGRIGGNFNGDHDHNDKRAKNRPQVARPAVNNTGNTSAVIRSLSATVHGTEENNTTGENSTRQAMDKELSAIFYSTVLNSFRTETTEKPAKVRSGGLCNTEDNSLNFLNTNGTATSGAANVMTSQNQ